MRRIALIHYQPLELYPPVMNFLDCWRSSAPDVRLDVYTTWCQAKVDDYSVSGGAIHIRRYGGKGEERSAAGRAWHYFRFYCFTLAGLLARRPDTVIYYESVSAFPACVYKRFLNRGSRLFIHYHEYMTPEEYAGGMRLVRWFHSMEKKLYGKAEWISHTNQARMDRFLADLKDNTIRHTFTLPNYPPESWVRVRGAAVGDPIRAVYVGALSLDTMYTREFAEWVLRQKGITWDIYSLNLSGDALEYIQGLPGGRVRLNPGVPYKQLPQVLSDYDLGVILYKGHVPNWIDNAPNKLFEYLACGLDVWFPDHLKGSWPFVRRDVYPKVLTVDFTRLDEWDLTQAMGRAGLPARPSTYTCERVYRSFLEHILKSDKKANR